MESRVGGYRTSRRHPAVSGFLLVRYLPLMLFYSARDTLFSAVHPLLKFIGSYTGCYVTLLAATMDQAEANPYFSTCVGPLVILSAALILWVQRPLLPAG